ncbi:hypothetical protein [Vibrio nigripulchritudo]|uniref:hypothetical protein n=1 Tax=Vibrio nigripulchritudo TaxID=28173 RepID=UPI00248F7809|nr:hypothetical protein [Vibrio nigripulchritudo]BDU35911.1 hypothetical protein TUMSATVNIG2_03800 [Vibrio nigripulchritudo]BDU41582.1 hypothetical protein TUMSATVNIG3_03800 [Vibrio nigripulchritudo]
MKDVLLVGTTNLDSTGTAGNLTVENATQAIIGTGWSFGLDEGVDLANYDWGHGGKIYARTEEWDKGNYKEAKIEGDSSCVYLENFVDVNVSLNNYCGSKVFINNSKRGDIETGCGHDKIYISVQSNNSLWENDFDISTGAGNDVIKMVDSNNSHLTDVTINAGSGHDFVDISKLKNAEDGIVRDVDGGSGFDKFVFGTDDSVDFKNFEVIVGTAQTSNFNLTSEHLKNNGFDQYGLVVTGSNFALEGVDSVSHSELSETQEAYLNWLGYDDDEYSALTVFDGSDTYTILTDSCCDVMV